MPPLILQHLKAARTRIAERAQAVLEALEDRQKATTEALNELEKLVEERVEAGKERERTGLDVNTFSIYWQLRRGGS